MSSFPPVREEGAVHCLLQVQTFVVTAVSGGHLCVHCAVRALPFDTVQPNFGLFNFGLPISIIPQTLHTYYFMKRTSGRSLGTFKQGSILLEIGGSLGREVPSGATRPGRCTSVSQKGGGSRVTVTGRAGGEGTVNCRVIYPRYHGVTEVESAVNEYHKTCKIFQTFTVGEWRVTCRLAYFSFNGM